MCGSTVCSVTSIIYSPQGREGWREGEREGGREGREWQAYRHGHWMLGSVCMVYVRSDTVESGC